MTQLKDIVDRIEQKVSPPVHLWQPDQCGEIDIRIDEQGFWFHEGDSIDRVNLVKLFASILWFEGGRHYLVTPVEKLQIVTEDAPFLINQVEFIESSWLVTTNLQEQMVVGESHPVELRLLRRQWVPYVKVRYDLWARVNRNVYYQWVTQAVEERINDGELQLSSSGYKFEVARE